MADSGAEMPNHSRIISTMVPEKKVMRFKQKVDAKTPTKWNSPRRASSEEEKVQKKYNDEDNAGYHK